MKKTRKFILYAVVIILALTAAFSLGRFVGKYSGKMGTVERLIEYFYPLEYDKEYIEDMAAKFMVMALEDPYSEYMTKEETDIFLESILGEYKGIGLTMLYDEESGKIAVTDVEEGGPAHVAGVKVGDILLEVDGIEFNYENYDRVYYYIKGLSEEAPDDDTEMKLTVSRENTELEFMLKRTMILYESVTSEENDGILYIKLTEFSENSALKFEEELSKYENIKGIILDLNDNGGGDIDSLIQIAELLLPKGLLLETENAIGEKKKYKISDDEYYDAPLAVLVNENTASASEVLSAAIKERGRGILVGETTYGKGLVQGIFPLGDGSALRLTIEKYYTAGGNYINEKGIEPDIKAQGEEQLEKAREYIKENVE